MSDDQSIASQVQILKDRSANQYVKKQAALALCEHVSPDVLEILADFLYLFCSATIDRDGDVLIEKDPVNWPRVKQVFLDAPETSVDLLLRKLRNGGGYAPVEILAEIGDPRCLPDLIQAALRNGEGKVHNHVVHLTVLRFSDLLNRSNLAVSAVDGLLVQVLQNLQRPMKLSDYVLSTHRDLFKALAGKLMAVDKEAAMSRFILYLRHPQAVIRYEAIKKLESLGDARAVMALVVALKDDDLRVRIAACDALATIGDRSAVDGLLGVLHYCTEPGFQQVVDHATRALGIIGDPRAIEPIAARIAKYDPYDYPSKETREALSHFGPAATDALLQYMYTQGGVRASVVQLLGDVGGQRAVDVLLRLLDSETDLILRDEIVRSLARIGDKRAIGAVITCIHDRDLNVRRAAVEALGELRAAESVEPLMQCFYDNDAWLRQLAAVALGKIGDERAVDILFECLQMPDQGVSTTQLREAAVRALGQIGGNRALAALEQASCDPDPAVRAVVWKVLRR